MSAVLGRTRAYGLGKESVAGTAVAATKWIPQMDLTVEDKIDRIYDTSALGTRFGEFAADTNMTSADGNINGVVYDQSFGMIALAAMGSVSTATHPSATGVKVHTFSIASTLPTYTISTNDANEGIRFAYGILDTLELKMSQGEYVSFASTWKALQGATAANTVTYVSENRFRPQDVVVKIASSVAGLGAATPLRVKDLTLKLNNNIITEPRLGTTNPDYYPGVVQTTLEMGRLYLDTSIKSLVFGTTPQAMSIAITRSDVQIGTGTPTNPSIVLTFQPSVFTQWGRDGGLDDLKHEAFTFQPIFSTTTSKAWDLALTNVEASY